VSNQAHQAREALGVRLRDLRKDAGLTGRALAHLAGWDLSKISKIEHGKRPASEDDIRVWCLHCQAEEHVADLIATRRNIEAMWLEWRRTLGTGTKRRQRTSVSLYEQTKLFRIYDPTGVVGVLQTAEYAAVILRQAVDFYEIPNDVEEGVAARMDRQRFLYEGDRRFNVLMGEQALINPVGGPDVMRGQLDRLLAVQTLPRLSLGIIPMQAPDQFWPLHPFITFDDRAAMVETYSAELTINQPRELALYAKAFAALQRSAVYGQPARGLISRALAALG
jgi:transcriptional regulator with XRE-family HTH domain